MLICENGAAGMIFFFFKPKDAYLIFGQLQKRGTKIFTSFNRRREKRNVRSKWTPLMHLSVRSKPPLTGKVFRKSYKSKTRNYFTIYYVIFILVAKNIYMKELNLKVGSQWPRHVKFWWYLVFLTFTWKIEFKSGFTI